MPAIYVLYRKALKKFFIGSTREENCQVRVRAHNSGKTRSTKFGRPWSLVHEENFPSYTEARKREIFLKSGQGRKWIREGWQSGRMRRSWKPLEPQGSRRFESYSLRFFRSRIRTIFFWSSCHSFISYLFYGEVAESGLRRRFAKPL